MPNIAVVNYCNLKCKYCFADDMIQEPNKTITLDDYKKILEFCSRVPGMNHIGIIGGEPTLHPHFDDILKETNIYCRECNTDATLFTNGIELEDYLPLIGDRVGLLINCNAPQYQNKDMFDKQAKVLDHLYDLCWYDRKASCGCNLYLDCTDYSYIWDIVKRYKLDHLRTSVVSPGGCYQCWRTKKEEYYNKMKPIFLEHCENALRYKCTLTMDCGHIPMCYFNLEEKDLVERACANLYQDFCTPVIDITPDFKATACFGAYDPVDIRDFNDCVELERYLMAKKNLPLAAANCTGKCASCKKAELLQCQGGCLGFAQIR